jgi:hypothetical protein
MLTIQIFHADPGTSEFEELELLLVLVKDYEDKHIVIPELEFQLNDDRNCAGDTCVFNLNRRLKDCGCSKPN